MGTASDKADAARERGEKTREERTATAAQTQGATRVEKDGKIKLQSNIENANTNTSHTTNEGGMDET